MKQALRALVRQASDTRLQQRVSKLSPAQAERFNRLRAERARSLSDKALARRLSIRLSPQEDARVRAEALRRGTNASEIVRLSLAENPLIGDGGPPPLLDPEDSQRMMALPKNGRGIAEARAILDRIEAKLGGQR